MSPLTYIDSFNKKVKLLILSIYNKNKNDALIYRTKERVMLICNMDPKLVIDNVGKVLYKFKEQIYEMNEDFALTHDFSKDLNADIKDFSNIMDRLKEMWTALPSEDKQEYIDLIQDLLDDYIEYLSCIHL